MNKDEIVIVSAFYNIGRGESEFQVRTCDNYFAYFDFWARINNRIIIYTTTDFAQRIIQIRDKYGMADRTTVIIEDEIWDVKSNYLSRMRQIEADGVFAHWRYKTKDMSNIADYSYIMLMKYYFLYKASDLLEEDVQICWLDFGWNHGGETYICPEEFNFTWKYAFPDKINLFSIKNPYSNLGIVALQKMSDTITGCNLVLRKSFAPKLYEYCCEALESLLSLDAFDDDQMLLRMACVRHPEDFNIIESDWFMVMKEFGGDHLSVKERNRNKQHKLSKVRNYLEIKNIKFALRIIEFMVNPKY